MKCIVLAKMSKRIFAATIDFVITLGIVIALFFAMILPLSIDEVKYTSNQKEMNDILIASRIYTRSSDTATPELIIDVVTSKLKDVNDPNAISYFNLYDNNGTKLSVVDSIARFYLDPPTYKDEKVFSVNEITESILKESVFKVGKPISNIEDLTVNTTTNTYEITMIDNEKQNVTIEFISQLVKPDHLESTTSLSEIVLTSKIYTKIESENKNMMLLSLIMIIPALFGTSLIFYLIIPLCSKNCETIGKYILGLGVLTADGYVLKKQYLIPRYFSFFIFEMAGGILTFGGFFLVSYIMFCFTKKRRSLHDFCSNSVVIDKKESTWFVDREQEYRYNYKTRV